MKKNGILAILAAAVLLFVLAAVPQTSGAGNITLTPTTQDKGLQVTVAGTNFAAGVAIGIGFGAEVQFNYTAYDPFAEPTPGWPYSGRWDEALDPPWISNGTTPHWPVKPGSFELTSDTTPDGGIVSNYWDQGDGTTMGSFESARGTINYSTGQWSRMSTVDLTAYRHIYFANYTYYEYNVTPAAGVTTDGSGAFSAVIDVPTVADGDYTVTVVDAVGNIATATLNVVPESLTLAVMLLLSTVAVIVSMRYYRKRPKWQN